MYTCYYMHPSRVEITALFIEGFAINCWSQNGDPLKQSCVSLEGGGGGGGNWIISGCGWRKEHN